MKYCFIWIVFIFAASSWTLAQPQVTLRGKIEGHRILSADTTYLLRGFVYVRNGGSLTIPPGTVIKGEKVSKGALIITRTGKINAQGTPEKPIIFTSSLPEGERDYGDWGGIIILGNAPVNCPGNNCTIEGGVDNSQGDGLYGGDNPEDSSGVFRYVHISFGGIAFQPDNEINGLTMAGVGSKTVIEYVQVSFAGDDAFEWFGGTVNCKYLVSLNPWDDDFDTDFGYTGKVQYALAIRDPKIADISLSNGFETDNSKGGAAFTPFTQPVFSNVTILGPLIFSRNINPNYQTGIHLRRNSKLNCFNSIIAGFPTCFILDGESTEQNAIDNQAVIAHNLFAGCDRYFATANIFNPRLNVEQWLSSGKNIFQNWSALQLQGPKFPYLPAQSSIAWNGARFDNAQLSNNFFDKVNFIGAFGQKDWTEPWVNWDPQNRTVVRDKNLSSSSFFRLYPNPTQDILFVTNPNGWDRITSLTLTDCKGQNIPLHYDAEEATDWKVDCRNLAPGLYILHIQTANGRTAQKFIKQ
jgi:hypothetical protein